MCGHSLFRFDSKVHNFCPHVEFYILAKDITFCDWRQKEQIMGQDKKLPQ